MTNSMSGGVRPTRRTLEQLGIALPPIQKFLHLLPHPIVQKAQRLPEEMSGGGGERVLMLEDRLWFKVKRQRWRAVCTELRGVDLERLPFSHSWWMGSAGVRTADSGDDFYATLAPFTTDSSPLLPTTWDEKRLVAEAGTLAVAVTQEAVIEAVAEALKSGEIIVLTLAQRDVRIRLKVLPDGEAYIAISFINTMEIEFMTTVLSSVPGVAPHDWQPEPTSPLHLPLEPGEMIFSTMLSIDAQRLLLGD
jgi:hypothetical protein